MKKINKTTRSNLITYVKLGDYIGRLPTVGDIGKDPGKIFALTAP